jgi:hypothetical protein
LQQYFPNGFHYNYIPSTCFGPYGPSSGDVCVCVCVCARACVRARARAYTECGKLASFFHIALSAKKGS